MSARWIVRSAAKEASSASCHAVRYFRDCSQSRHVPRPARAGSGGRASHARPARSPTTQPGPAARRRPRRSARRPAAPRAMHPDEGPGCPVGDPDPARDTARQPPSTPVSNLDHQSKASSQVASTSEETPVTGTAAARICSSHIRANVLLPEPDGPSTTPWRAVPSPGRRSSSNRAAVTAAAAGPRGPTLSAQASTERRPEKARPRVTSSAYSRSPPTGRPLASRVTDKPGNVRSSRVR